MRADTEVSVLLVEDGGWLAGLDSQSVLRIDRAETSDVAPCLSEIMGGCQEAAGHVTRRCLTVGGGNAKRRVLIERTRETRSVTAATLHEVPLVLRRNKAPMWWLGMTWIEGEPVMLLDLFSAAVAHERRRLA